MHENAMNRTITSKGRKCENHYTFIPQQGRCSVMGQDLADQGLGAQMRIRMEQRFRVCATGFRESPWTKLALLAVKRCRNTAPGARRGSQSEDRSKLRSERAVRTQTLRHYIKRAYLQW